MTFKNIFIFVTPLVVVALPTVAQNQESLMTDVLKIIFANIFKPHSMSVSIISNVGGHEHFKVNQKILDPLMRMNKEIQVPVAINRYTSAKLTHFMQAKLIFTTSAKDVQIHTESHNNEVQRISTKYVIVLNNQNRRQVKLREMQTIFKKFYKFFIIDVAVLTVHENFLEIYTYKPYSKEYCGSTKPLLIQRFANIPNLLQYHDLYPEKSNNFYQCPMKVVLWHLPPFVTIAKNDKALTFSGLDVDILKDLAKFLNFSIEFVPNEPANYLGGTVFHNKTAVGVFKMLTEGRANLSIGFIGCSGERRQLTTASNPYFISEMVILMRNSQKYTPLQLLLRPFSKLTWGLLIVITILRYFLGRKFHAYSKLPHSFRKLLRLQWLFLFFIVRISYEGSMFQALRSSPYQPLPQTLDELVKQNYGLIADYASARILREIPFLWNITTIVPGNPETVLESIDTSPPKIGIITFNAFLTPFMESRQRNYTDYAIVREKVANTMICVFFPKYSFMTSSVSELLRKYGMFGIIEKFAKDYGFQNLPITTQQRSDNKEDATPLDFSFLKKIFLYFSIMNSISVIVFLLEIVSQRCKMYRCSFNRNCKIF